MEHSYSSSSVAASMSNWSGSEEKGTGQRMLSPTPVSPTTPAFLRRPLPFATPALSARSSQPSTRPPTRPVSVLSCSSSSQSSVGEIERRNKDWFRSRKTVRRTKENRREVKRNPKDKWLWIIPSFGFLAGFAICGLLIYRGLQKEQYTYTLILDEDFTSGVLNPNVWTFEQEVGGFGNHQFDMTTNSPDNVFIKNSQLYIQPTLQNASLVNQNSVIDLTASGACTSTEWYNCITSTNTTNGTIVQPARSARLNTKLGASIRYGRIEVTAKLSQGDWLWPAIWMMPVNDVYGAWPRSGEIDILESHGNNHSYVLGNNIASSALHYGPDFGVDGYLKTVNQHAALHSEYGDGFHVYGLEWTPEHIFTYIDSRLLQVLYVKIDESFWTRGQFPLAAPNGSIYMNPWAASNQSNSAPFDQAFYLILDVAVGGQNGWFPDGQGGKPWTDASASAKNEFWNAQSQWYPTWANNSAMIIDRVQMWQQDM